MIYWLLIFKHIICEPASREVLRIQACLSMRASLRASVFLGICVLVFSEILLSDINLEAE